MRQVYRYQKDESSQTHTLLAPHHKTELSGTCVCEIPIRTIANKYSQHPLETCCDMFTGIINGMGKVTYVTRSKRGAETIMRVRLGKLGRGLKRGDSICIN